MTDYEDCQYNDIGNGMTLCERCGGSREIEDCQYNDIGNGVDGWWSCEVRPCPVCVTGEEEPAWYADAPDVEEEW